jgi:hypothetical protein
LLAFQLLIAFHTLILPLTARNIKSSGVSKSNHSEILVIMASGINVTTIYNSFSDFKKMFGVEFPDDRRIAFKNGEGEFRGVYHVRSACLFPRAGRSPATPLQSRKDEAWAAAELQRKTVNHQPVELVSVTFCYWHAGTKQKLAITIKEKDRAGNL